MPTFATRTSSGFTLLELLVVMALLAILTGTVILGFTGADTEQRLRGEAERLAVRVELARQHALTRNREWGLYLAPDSYYFAEFDPAGGKWIAQTGRPLGEVTMPDFIRLRLVSKGAGQVPFADQKDLPKVLVFSSGEVTPFDVYLEPTWDASAWVVSTDGLSRVAAERADAG